MCSHSQLDLPGCRSENASLAPLSRSTGFQCHLKTQQNKEKQLVSLDRLVLDRNRLELLRERVCPLGNAVLYVVYAI